MEKSHSDVVIPGSIQSSRWHKYKSYVWQLDLVKQEFSCDPEAMSSLFGYSQSSIAAKKLLKLLPKAQRCKARAVFKSVIASHKPRYFHCCVMTPNSLFSYVEFRITAESQSLLKGTVLPCLVIPSGVVAAELFYSMFENQHHGMLVTDNKTRILACNRHFEKTTGYVLEDLIGLKTSVFNAKKLHENFYQTLWDNIETDGHWNGVILTKKADGTTFPQELTIHRVSPGNGESYFLGLSTDLSNQLQRIDGREAGGVDLLTQLPDAENFIRKMERENEETGENSVQIMLALQPQFPVINGPEVKRQFASYIMENKLVSFASYVGEGRFAVVLRANITQEYENIRIIRQSINAFFHSFKHAQIPVALALKHGLTGVSLSDSKAVVPKKLLSHALQALLELHLEENKRVAFYDRNLHAQVERKKKLEVWANDVISNGLVEVFFQPIVDIKKGLIDKFEALCRFPQHPEIKVSTQEIISIVEDIDKVVELDDIVNLKAISTLAELQSLFGEHAGLSVNRSFNSTQDISTILSHSIELIEKTGVSMDSMTIEFTESAYFEGDRYQEALLSSIRKAGVSIAVDDFGTGFASFDYLNKNYFDVLKIDQSLIKGIGVKNRQYHVVNTIVQLAQKLKLKVVVEGVETQNEYMTLRDLGVDCIQGYFFSKPLPIDELRTVSNYCELPVIEGSIQGNCGTISELATPNLPRVDPGESLSLIYNYFGAQELNVLPVVESNQCVGLIDRGAMNLHMTPSMGTDHETNKEQSIWQKAAHRMMSAHHSTLDWQLPLCEVKTLLSMHPLPWVLVDSDSRFKGVVEQRFIIGHLIAT
ncbi:EAL domain-containing protein [Vibrio pectenicida]|uniref:EAL domain-containing protein n=1 Tax=Vibrio pectenicida TaxID=62763 RepID=A0A3R9FNF5_9VIBR|nr:EAL domain-containing protein [Vibrio pectenicida]RSD32120.1 EAL domain-containing protein [Vibrio pectenicida]